MEILEFHDMVEATEESLVESDPVELNSFEFFKLYPTLRFKQMEHLVQMNQAPLARLKVRILGLRSMRSKVNN